MWNQDVLGEFFNMDQFMEDYESTILDLYNDAIEKRKEIGRDYDASISIDEEREMDCMLVCLHIISGNAELSIPVDIDQDIIDNNEDRMTDLFNNIHMLVVLDSLVKDGFCVKNKDGYSLSEQGESFAKEMMKDLQIDKE
jgi:hypothetical protein